VLAELANRGVRDILIACCDGLEGLPEAIEATFARTVVQTCTVHLIRAVMRYVSSDDRKRMAAALRPIYTAPTAEAADTVLLALGESELGRRYPGVIAVWERAWERFTPFLAFPPDVRKIIYTTNAIESLNYQLRKTIKNRGHFPTDDAVIKLLWHSIRDIEDKRARAQAKEAGIPKSGRKAGGRLVEGRVTNGWKQALNALTLAHPRSHLRRSAVMPTATTPAIYECPECEEHSTERAAPTATCSTADSAPADPARTARSPCSSATCSNNRRGTTTHRKLD